MTRYAALLAVLLAVTACGARPESAGAPSGSSSSPTRTTPSASAPHACPDHVVEGQSAQADLDGNGTPDDVTFAQPAGSGCPGGLTARIGSTPVKAETGSIVPTSMRAVTVPGRKGQLLVVRETHPRGGFQDHLFGYADGTLKELTVDGHALLPFVATDTPGSGLDGFTARCTNGGIEVLRAVAQHVSGVAPKVAVQTTSYAIDGNTLTASAVATMSRAMSGAELDRDYPALAKRSVLTDGCR